MKPLFVGASLAWVIACAARSPENSQIDHIWGQTRRNNPALGASLVCRSTQPENPESAKLRALAARIANANPSAFSNEFDVSKMCFSVSPSIGGLDARTTPEALRIDFSPDLMALFANEDEMAAVLSHELAHVTLQHQGFGEAPPRMVSDELFVQLQSEGRLIQARIVELAKAKADPARIFELNAEFAMVMAQMNKRIDEVYGEENAHVNWLEQEADEAGAEFFVRAGFDRRAFIEILWTSHRSPDEERAACSRLIERALAEPRNAERPARGNKSHPSTCWRVYHLTVDEWEHAHAGEIAKLKP
ncbi:MAG: M48 family metalloprotease [Silvanigrellaceae bacterium]